MPTTHGLSESEYDELPGLRSSTINAVLDCPAKYKWRLDHPDTAKHFTIGSAVHSLVLEDGARVLHVDADNWRTKAAQNQRDDALAAGDYPLNNPEYDQAKAMAESIQGHPQVAPHLLEGHHETTLTGIDPVTFMPIKARLDIMNIPARTIVDIKTTTSANPDDFSSHAYRYGYHVQAAHYIAMAAQETETDPDEWTFLFALVEKDGPWLSHVTQLHPEFLKIGEADRRHGIDVYRECMRTDTWPGYTTSITTTIAPKWALHH